MAKEYGLLNATINQQTAGILAGWFKHEGGQLFNKVLDLSNAKEQSKGCKIRPSKKESGEEYEHSKIVACATACAYERLLSDIEILKSEKELDK